MTAFRIVCLLTRRWSFVSHFAIYLSSAILLTGCTEIPNEPLKVGTNVWPGYECLYLARDLGYYDGSAIRLVEYTSASEVIRAYKNKIIDVAALTMDEVFLLARGDESPRITLVMDYSNGGDALIATPEIKTLGDLKGKRIGVETTALGAYFLTRALEKGGLTERDITIVPLEVNEHKAAFLEKRIDAAVTFDPVRTELLNSGGKILFDSSKISGEIVDVLVVRDEVLNRRREDLHSLLAGWFKALDYYRKKPLEAAGRMAPREGLTGEEFTESMKGLFIPDVNENRAILDETDPKLIDGMNRLARFMVETNLLQNQINLEKILAPGPVKDLK